jgi:hypothetical protein
MLCGTSRPQLHRRPSFLHSRGEGLLGLRTEIVGEHQSVPPVYITSLTNSAKGPFVHATQVAVSAHALGCHA